MKIKRIIKTALVAVLCLAMILPVIPMEIDATVNNFSAAGTGFHGKRLSILGDSISTYGGISNSTYFNTTIGSNTAYYSAGGNSLTSDAETWWMQTIDTLGMSLCVNNSWSGSCVSDRGSGNSVAYKSRCTQLHNDNYDTDVNPDIIAIYMGTNDMKNITSAAQHINASGASYPMGATMNADGTATVTFNYSTVTAQVSTASYEPTSILEAYALMVYRSLNKYQNAEIYCFTLLPNESQTQYNREMYKLYNAGIRAIVKHFNDSGKKIYLVDLYEDSGITSDLDLLDYYFENTLHPNPQGMDVIANCFLSSLVSNSQYAGTTVWNPVSYELNDVYLPEGKVTAAATGQKFAVSLLPTRSQFDLKVTVTMNGMDVTATCYNGGTVKIDEVTGPVRIEAEAVYETQNYRWELKNDNLESCTPDGGDYNVSSEIDTNETIRRKGSCPDGFFSDTHYAITNSVVLRNEEPWVIEWKGSGTWENNILFTKRSSDAVRNDSYVLFDSNQLLGFGYRKAYNNGAEFPAGHAYYAADTSGLTLNNSTSHTYRLVNKISDDSNMVYLYVDNNTTGTPLNSMYTHSSGTLKKTGVQDNWISGRDFVFSFIGSENRPLNQCGIEYIQVWEGGQFNTLRLDQLRVEFETYKANLSGSNGFSAYTAAVNKAGTAFDNQSGYDNLTNEIIVARNQLTQSCDANTESGQILKVDLLSGEYARVGKQVGLQIMTAPDVANLTIGSKTLATVSSRIQTIQVQDDDGNYQDALVKIWLVTFKEESASADKKITYTISTYLTGSSTAKSSIEKEITFK